MPPLAVTSCGVPPMATSDVTRASNAKSIKLILVGISGVLGVLMLLAFLAGLAGISIVYALVGVVLLAQAAFYWTM